METQNTKNQQSTHFSIPAKTLGLIIFLAVIAGVLVYIALLPQKGMQNIALVPAREEKTVEDTILSIEPAQGNTNRNRVYNVNIDTGKNKVTGVQLELVFDPNVLRNVTVSSSDFLPEPLELLNNVDTKNGRISLALTVSPEQDGVIGRGNLAQISFTLSSQSAFPTFIKFLPKTEVSAQNTAFSVLKEAKDAQIDFVLE